MVAFSQNYDLCAAVWEKINPEFIFFVKRDSVSNWTDTFKKRKRCLYNDLFIKFDRIISHKKHNSQNVVGESLAVRKLPLVEMWGSPRFYLRS